MMTLIGKSFAIVSLSNSMRGISLDESMADLDESGVYSYRQLKGTMKIQITGVPTEQITFVMVAPAEQHFFGICNRDLDGACVTQRKSEHCIEHWTTLQYPFSPEMIPSLKIADQ